MTSQQPGPPQRVADADGGPARPGAQGFTGSQDRGAWLVRVAPVALLIVLGLAGLRGSVTAPRWNGHWHQDGPLIGVGLEGVLAVLLVVLLVRRRAAPSRDALAADAQAGSSGADVADKLRTALLVAFTAAMVGLAGLIISGLDLHLFSAKPGRPFPGAQAPRPRQPTLLPRQSRATGGPHIPLTGILYGLLIALLVAAVAVSIWWSSRLRKPVRGDVGPVATDAEDLRDAVESGRAALRRLDDARAAIIACYRAMEDSLAERGQARAVADTPDELLARATASGVVRGTAAARLTALFYEARFSSHPVGAGQRDEAERALDELAAALAPAEASA